MISILLPTYGRPHFAMRFLASIADTVSNFNEVEVCLFVNEEDEGSHHLDSPYYQVTRIIGPRLSMGGQQCLSAESAGRHHHLS